MTDAARVAGKVHPRREVFRHQAGRTVGFRHGGKHILRKLCALLQKDNVIRLTLILQQVAVMPAVTELEPRPVGKDKRLVRAVVLRNAVQLTHRRQQVVFFQLRVRSSHEKHLNAVIAQAEQLGLHACDVALAAASRTAVSDIPRPAQQKILLFGVRTGKRQPIHSANASSSGEANVICAPALSPSFKCASSASCRSIISLSVPDSSRRVVPV